MKKLLQIACMVAIIGFVFKVGCSKADRDEAINRVTKVAKSLNGEVRPDDAEHDVPNVVAQQQRKERIRQNTTWTAENRALHPIEYCQAQLEDLNKYAARLEVAAHEKACSIAAVKRTLGDGDTTAQSLKKFLAEAKKTYKECEAANSWPAKLGGYALSREKTQEKIIDAAQKLSEIQAKAGSKQNQLVALEKTLKITQNEQKRVVKIREQIQNTINDLRIKNVIEGDDSIVATLNAIEDSMGVLGVDYDDPKVESIIMPDEKAKREELFNKIMAE